MRIYKHTCLANARQVVTKECGAGYFGIWAP